MVKARSCRGGRTRESAKRTLSLPIFSTQIFANFPRPILGLPGPGALHWTGHFELVKMGHFLNGSHHFHCKIATVKTSFLRTSLWRVFFSLYLLFSGFLLSCLLAIAVSILSLSQAFRYHFWYFQIKHRKLGCTFEEWREGKPRSAEEIIPEKKTIPEKKPINKGP